MEKTAVEHVHVVARENYRWHGTFFCPCGYLIGVLAYETVLSAPKLRGRCPLCGASLDWNSALDFCRRNLDKDNDGAH